jgi:3-dehydrosphinganine reductase
MISFHNKTALITGGSSGIGKALALELLNSGCSVIICARDSQKLNSAKDELITNSACESGRVFTLPLDITDFDLVQIKISEFLEVHPTPDILINCAGSAHPGEFQDLSMDKFHWLMDVNLFGTIHMTKALLPAMQKRGSGHIVNISSAAGFVGVYGYTAYCASKYAVRGFTDALRSELRLNNIQMSLVFPPDTDTPQLVYEAEYKPPITKALAGTAGILLPSNVAKTILKGVAKSQYIIVPGLENALLYHLSNILGPNVYFVMDRMVDSAVKSIKS